MFVRIKRSVQQSGTYEYLHIAESNRDEARIRPRVIGNLGRRDQLVADGTLDSLLHFLAKFNQRLRVVEKVRTEGPQAHRVRSWGPALVFDIERACFALALQRLCAPGSDPHGAAAAAFAAAGVRLPRIVTHLQSAVTVKCLEPCSAS